MLPKDSVSQKTSLDGYDCTRKIMDSLFIERTLVLKTQIYFLPKNERSYCKLCRYKPLVEIPAAHTSTAGLCCMLRGGNLELDCDQNS